MPEKETQYPFYRRLDGPKGQSGSVQISSPLGFEPWTVQPTTGGYTNYTILAHNRKGSSLCFSPLYHQIYLIQYISIEGYTAAT